MRRRAKGDQYAQPVIASAASRDIVIVIAADSLDYAVKIALTTYPPPPPEIKEGQGKNKDHKLLHFAPSPEILMLRYFCENYFH